MRRTFCLNRGLVIGSVVLLAQFVFAAVNTDPPTGLRPSEGSPTGRSNETLTNCTPAAIEDFPKPFFNPEEREQGWIAVNIVIAVYMFVCLSTLCEDYFIPSIEVLTEAWQIDPDVAGATFMAAASSIPAIAASIIAILVAKGDLGVSTALGSAVLNAAGVVGVSALFAGKVILLHRWPMYRDNFFFLISVALLLIVMYDDLITWYESAVLVIMYIVYAIFMSFDAILEKFFVENIRFLQDKVDCTDGIFPAQAQIEDTSSPVPITLSRKDFDLPPQVFRASEKRFSISSYRKSVGELPATIREIFERNQKHAVNAQNVVDPKIVSQESISTVSLESLQKTPHTKLHPPKSHLLKVLWLLYLPFAVLFYLTIPDCRKPKLRKYFAVTFILSTLHITVASYLLVWMIAIIGFTLSISDTVMGLSFLAIGVTLPDIVASLLVVRKGEGDMAVCNALGSNIFEILVGLGLPWLIKTAIMEPGMPIVVESRGMMYSTVSLLATLVFLIALTHWNNWRMDKFYGAVLMVWYLVFLAFSTAYEVGVFGNTKPPTCATDF